METSGRARRFAVTFRVVRSLSNELVTTGDTFDGTSERVTAAPSHRAWSGPVDGLALRAAGVVYVTSDVERRLPEGRYELGA
jgi:hypothetical protein